MNIAICYPTPFNVQIGGVERVSDILAREFTRRGHRIFFLHNYRKELVPEYDYPVEVLFFPQKDYRSEENLRWFHDFLISNNIDIVINQCGAHGDSLLYNNINGSKAKVISTIHFNPLMSYKFYWYELVLLRNNCFTEKIKRIVRCSLYWKLKRDYFKRLQNHYRWLFCHSDKICILSKFFESELKQLSTPYYRHEKVSIIGNPVSSPQKTIQQKENIILWVGRFDMQQKRPDLCIKIWRKIKNKFTDWQLIMVGDGKDFERVKTLYGNTDRVKFTGFTNPYSYYKRAKILVMTSAFEGWGMVLTEAMSYGVVPMAFDSFLSLKDLIQRDEQLIQPFDLIEYARKLSILISNDTLLCSLREKGYKVTERFFLCNVADKWESLFNEKLSYS